MPDDSVLKNWLQPSLEANNLLHRPIQNALALYVVSESKTVTYPVGATMERVADLGPRSEIIDTAISPDNSKIAFTYGGAIQLLDIASGKIQVLYPSTTRGGFRPSWSPDGRHIVFERDHELVILEISSGNTRFLGRGNFPAWSPTGEWIAHFDESNKKLLLTRPDGSAQKELKDLVGSWRSFLRPWVSFEQTPIWSPDGKQLLLNVFLGETLRLAPITEVALVDVTTGKMKRMRKNGLSIAGWAEHKSK